MEHRSHTRNHHPSNHRNHRNSLLRRPPHNTLTMLKSRHNTKRYKKRGETLWRARAIITQNGTDKTISATGRTKKEADAKLDDRITKLLTNTTPPGTTQTVTQLYAQLLSNKKTGSRPRKKSTITESANLYKRHIQPYIGNKPLNELEYNDIEQLIQKPIQRGHRRTAQRVQQIMGEIYRYAQKRYRRDIVTGKLILLNLMEDFDPVYIPPTDPPELWTPEQLELFLKASEEAYHERITSLLHPLFYLAVAAGLRRGELIGLPSDALVWRDGQAFIDVRTQIVFQTGLAPYRDTPKSRAGVRLVPVGEDVVRVLETHKERLALIRAKYDFIDHGLMFPTRTGQHFMPNTYYAYWHRLIKRLGLPKAVPHQLRKTYISYLTQQLINAGQYDPKLIMRVAGHSDYRVTMETYTLATAKQNAPAFEIGTILEPQNPDSPSRNNLNEDSEEAA